MWILKYTLGRESGVMFEACVYGCALMRDDTIGRQRDRCPLPMAQCASIAVARDIMLWAVSPYIHLPPICFQIFSHRGSLILHIFVFQCRNIYIWSIKIHHRLTDCVDVELQMIAVLKTSADVKCFSFNQSQSSLSFCMSLHTEKLN